MAQRVEWSDEYLLGIPEIDNQHKKLVAIANDLYDSATAGGDSYKIQMSKVLKSLTDYTVYHFSNEEAFMQKYGYTGFTMHKFAHDNFIDEVNNQIRRLSSDSTEAGLQFYDYIVRWLLSHIAKADQVWAKFVKEKMNS